MNKKVRLNIAKQAQQMSDGKVGQCTQGVKYSGWVKVKKKITNQSKQCWFSSASPALPQRPLPTNNDQHNNNKKHGGAHDYPLLWYSLFVQ